MTPKRRYCLVSQEYPPETAHGGIGSQTYLKAHGLAAMGHRVVVLSRSLDDDRHEYQDGPVQVVRIAGFEARLAMYTEPVDWVTYSCEVACAISELHARDPIDLIDFPEWAGEGFIHLLNRSEWGHVPAVVQIHGPIVMFAHSVGWPAQDSELYRTGTLMESSSLRLADAVYSSSACSADWCARHYHLDRAAIPVIHTGVDTELFRRQPVAQSCRPTIIFVGRVTGDKGVPLLVEAGCRLAPEFPELQIRLIGRGDELFIRELSETAQRRNAPDLLDFAGFVKREELPDHLSRAHIFAGPSTYEPGPGLVYLEAMACGLPVVACESAGAAEVVSDEETGLLIPPGNADALTVALRRLLTDAALRRQMSAQAEQYARTYADSKVCIERIEAFYSSVIERSIRTITR